MGNFSLAANNSIEDFATGDIDVANTDNDGDNVGDVVISGISNEINTFEPRVYINETITSLLTIEVFNSIGQLVYADNDKDQNSQVNLKQPSGMYLITIESDNTMTARKLVIK